MANPSKLFAAISEAFGIPETTVFQHDRMLVAAGIRRSGARGRHAAITPVDAANLLIVIMGAPIFGPAIKESANTLRKYQNLPAWVDAAHLTPGAWGRPLPNLPSGHGLRDAIAEIISSFASGRFLSPINIWPDLKQDISPEVASKTWPDFPETQDLSDPGEMGVNVQIESPRLRARIDIRGWTSIPNLLSDHEALHYFEVPKENVFHQRPDIEQTREFTEVSLKHISAVFSDNR